MTVTEDSLSHTRWECKYNWGRCSANGSALRRSEGKPDSRGACHGGPCAHAARHSAEVQCLAARGIHQRQVRDFGLR